MPTLIELLDRRDRVIRPTPWQCKRIGVDRLAAASDGETVPDTGNMSCAAIISTQTQDRSRDIVVTAGIDLSAHRLNPVVLLNHGMGEDQKGIGRAEDESGQYTVRMEPARLLSVTHFSQKSELAEQVFALIVERILRGTSIQFIPKKTTFLPEDADNRQFYPGLLVEECELVEYSFTPLPDNPECVVQLESILSKGRLGGRPMLDSIRKSLTAFVPERNVSINVPGEVPVAETKTAPVPVVKAVEPPDPQRKEPVDDPLPDPVKKEGLNETAASDGGAMVEDKRPPGARALSGMHERFMEACSYLEEQMAGQEPGSQASEHLNKIAESMLEHTNEIAESYGSIYPDLDPLQKEEEAAEEPKTETKGGGDDEQSYPDEDDTEDARPKKFRCDTPARQALRQKVASFLAQRKSISEAAIDPEALKVLRTSTEATEKEVKRVKRLLAAAKSGR